jgi:hypothetical protein
MVEQTPRHIRVEVDLDPVIDEAHHFITMKWPRPNPREALGDLGFPRNRFVPIECLDQMVLAGVTRREDVAEFLTWCFDPEQFDVR